MKNYNFLSIHRIALIIILLTLLSSEYSFSQLTSIDGNVHLREQQLYGDNNTALYWNSNHTGQTQMIFRDKDNERYGQVFGNANGGRFGLLDGDGNWSYQAVKDNHTSFLIDNIERMRIQNDGDVGIGTDTPNYKLDVCGVMRAKEILVEDDWCDFVFEPEYCLTTLEEEEAFIKLYGHLSNFESAKAMDGMINVNDIFKRQQIQIEENVLHLIELNAENNALQIQVDNLTDDVETLKVDLANSNETIQALIRRIEILEAASR